MADLLETPAAMRAVQRHLLRVGPRTLREVARSLHLDEELARERMSWLADRGFVTELTGGIAGLGGEPRWQTALRAHVQRSPSARADALLASLEGAP